MKGEERNFTVATEKKRITVPLTSVPSLCRVHSERDSLQTIVFGRDAAKANQLSEILQGKTGEARHCCLFRS